MVNEREMLGEELVLDYLTSVKGAFYGWPYSYFGSMRAAEEGRATRSRREGDSAPLRAGGPMWRRSACSSCDFSGPLSRRAFITFHGSWNRTKFAGYKVVFVPFIDGQPSGAPRTCSPA
jgi:glucose/arabinose dehydrogenase